MKLRITVEGKSYDVDVEVLDMASGPPPTRSAGALDAIAPSRHNTPPLAATAAAATGAGDVPSPIAGTVTKIAVKPGDAVKVNETLLVLEAMKMESNVASPASGTVREVLVKPGDAVQAGQVLVRLG